MIDRAHQMYREGMHKEALGFYTEALAMAKTKLQKTALQSNKADCYLKLHNFKKGFHFSCLLCSLINIVTLFRSSYAVEECTSVLEVDQYHTGALMLPAQTLVNLKEYHSAVFEVNRFIELNPSSEVYQNLEVPLRMQLSVALILESEAEFEEEVHEEYKEEAEPFRYDEKYEIYEEKECGSNVASKVTVKSVDLSSSTTADANFISPKPPTKKAISEQAKDLKVNSVKKTILRIGSVCKLSGCDQ
ncbi:hypothetical protein UlMin_033404 [Ulmus minor]